jgi:hypothetical protein
MQQIYEVDQQIIKKIKRTCYKSQFDDTSMIVTFTF